MSKLILCSKHRSAGSVSQGEITLPYNFINAKKISLDFANIPNTVYTFNGDTFTFLEAAGAITLAFTITGAYTATQLALYLQTQMISVSAATGNSYVYVVVYHQPTGKLQFSTGANFSILASTSTFPYYRLGFTAVDAGPATAITAPNVVSLEPPKVALFEFSNISTTKSVKQSSPGGDLGHFIIPMVGNSFSIADYFERTGFVNEMEVYCGGVPKIVHYRILDPEARCVLALQSDWLLVLNIN